VSTLEHSGDRPLDEPIGRSQSRLDLYLVADDAATGLVEQGAFVPPHAVPPTGRRFTKAPSVWQSDQRNAVAVDGNEAEQQLPEHRSTDLPRLGKCAPCVGSVIRTNGATSRLIPKRSTLRPRPPSGWPVGASRRSGASGQAKRQSRSKSHHRPQRGLQDAAATFGETSVATVGGCASQRVPLEHPGSATLPGTEGLREQSPDRGPGIAESATDTDQYGATEEQDCAGNIHPDGCGDDVAGRRQQSADHHPVEAQQGQTVGSLRRLARPRPVAHAGTPAAVSVSSRTGTGSHAHRRREARRRPAHRAPGR
jgi:hypothetical protein